MTLVYEMIIFGNTNFAVMKNVYIHMYKLYNRVINRKYKLYIGCAGMYKRFTV